MTKRLSPRPTDAELAILRVLWRRGPSTVREVHRDLGGREGRRGDAGPEHRERGPAYTTTLTLLQIMAAKGLVVRNESTRSHVYKAAVGEQQTQRQMLRDLLDRVFGGSAGSLVMQLLATRKASPEELAEIRRLLDEHSREGS